MYKKIKYRLSQLSQDLSTQTYTKEIYSVHGVLSDRKVGIPRSVADPILDTLWGVRPLPAIEGSHTFDRFSTGGGGCIDTDELCIAELGCTLDSVTVRHVVGYDSEFASMVATVCDGADCSTIRAIRKIIPYQNPF